MLDPVTWIIFVITYAPLHYMGPVLLGLFTGMETPAERRQLIKAVLIDCTVSLIVSFALAIWLIETHLETALLVLILALFAPYTYIWIHRRRRGTAWFPSGGEE